MNKRFYRPSCRSSVLVPLLVLILFAGAVVVANMTLLQGLVSSTIQQNSNMGRIVARNNAAVAIRAGVRNSLDTPTTSFDWTALSPNIQAYLNFAGLASGDENWTMLGVTGTFVNGDTYTPFDSVNNTTNYTASTNYWSPRNPYTYWTNSCYQAPLTNSVNLQDVSTSDSYNFTVTTVPTELQMADIPFVSYNKYDAVNSTIPVVVNGDAIFSGGVTSGTGTPEMTVSGRTVFWSTNAPTSGIVTYNPALSTYSTTSTPVKGTYGVTDATNLVLYPATDPYTTNQSYACRAYTQGRAYNFDGTSITAAHGSTVAGIYTRSFDALASPQCVYVDAEQLQSDPNVYYYINCPAGSDVVIAGAVSAQNTTATPGPIVIATNGNVTLRNVLSSNVTRPVIVVTSSPNVRILSSVWVDGADSGSPTASANNATPSGGLTWNGRLVLLAPNTQFNPSFFPNNENWNSANFIINGGLAVNGGALTGPVAGITVQSAAVIGTATVTTVGMNMGAYGERLLYVQGNP